MHFLDYPIGILPNKDFLIGVISIVKQDEIYTLIKTVGESKFTNNDEDKIFTILTHKGNPNFHHISLL